MTQRLDGVQWARALAAFSVAFGHAAHEVAKIPGAAGVSQTLLQIPFQAGVDIFFVISGFIMVYTGHGRMDRPGYAGMFFRARLVRVVPVYWAYTGMIAVVALVYPQSLDTAVFSLKGLITSLSFYPTWQPPPLLKLGWTLNYEMFFYAVFALLIWGVGRWAVLGLMVIFPALALAGLIGVLPEGPLSYWARPLILEFCMGAGLALLYLRGVRMPAGVAVALIALGLVLIVAMVPLGRGTWRPVSMGVPALLIVAGFALTETWATAKGWLGRFGVLLGDVSYTTYLMHPFAITVCYLAWAALGPDGALSGALYFCMTLIMILIGSIIGYRVLEQPLIAWTRRLFFKPKGL